MTTLTADKKKVRHLRQQVRTVVPTSEEKNMNSIAQTTDTVEGEVRHPAWCDPSHCQEDRSGGYLRDVTHWSSMATRTVRVGGRPVTVSLELDRSDNFDGRLLEGERVGTTAGYIDAVALEGDIDVDDLEAFGQWLVERAVAYRQAIATQGAGR